MGNDQSRYEPTDQGLMNDLRRARYNVERMNDFIEWLFDVSEHCDHITRGEAFQEFEEWEEKQHDKTEGVNP